MDISSAVRSLRRPAGWLGAVAAVSTLAACYVVPIDPRTGQAVPPPHAAVAAAPALPLSFQARLYPANELASGHGVISRPVSTALRPKTPWK